MESVSGDGELKTLAREACAQFSMEAAGRARDPQANYICIYIWSGKRLLTHEDNFGVNEDAVGWQAAGSRGAARPFGLATGGR